MRKICILTTKNDVEISIQKGHRFRLVAKNLTNGVTFAPPIIKPWQFKSAINNAFNWTPPKEKIMVVTHGNITATLEGDLIVIEDKGAGHRYTVNANEIGINELGNETDLTWREAIKLNRLIIQNDELDGHSWGQHGSIFVV